MPYTTLLQEKIKDAHFQKMICQYAHHFSPAEHDLLHDILSRFEFDILQTQALAQAVLQQSRFDPNANHILNDDDDETTNICQHCLNPPIPPLRDYEMWRTKISQ